VSSTVEASLRLREAWRVSQDRGGPYPSLEASKEF
jgi:hypothetical protein